MNLDILSSANWNISSSHASGQDLGIRKEVVLLVTGLTAVNMSPKTSPIMNSGNTIVQVKPTVL